MEQKILLSPGDLEKIKAQIKSEVVQELKDSAVKPNIQDPFAEVRKLYASYKGSLYYAFGGTYWAAAWECIRKIATYCVGEKYVRDLIPNGKAGEAAEIAEFLCKYLLEKRGPHVQ